MALGDSPITTMVGNISNLIQSLGITVNVSRTDPTQFTQKSIFGTPQNYTPSTFTANVVISSLKGNELEVIAGGKPKEILMLITQPGTFKENDEITYNNLVYKVNSITQHSPFGSDLCDKVQAEREVVP